MMRMAASRVLAYGLSSGFRGYSQVVSVGLIVSSSEWKDGMKGKKERKEK